MSRKNYFVTWRIGRTPELRDSTDSERLGKQALVEMLCQD
jgi:hypothetical protein